MSQLGAAPQPPVVEATPVAVAGPVHSVLPVIWEQGERGVLRSFLFSAWRLGERGRRTWPTVAREGGGPASATLYALLCSFAGTTWYAGFAAVAGFSYARGELDRGVVDSLLLGLGAADAVLLAGGLVAVAAALFSAGCARFFLRNQPARPGFGALYRIHCYGQSPAVFGLAGASLAPGVLELLCVFCRATGYELVLGIPRGKALLASFLPPALVAGLLATGLLIAVIWNNL